MLQLGMEGDENIIEARFESDGYYGTIRFKGQVAGTKGTVNMLDMFR